MRAYGARKKRSLSTLVNDLKSKPCTDCGQTFHPAAMDFDHINDDKSYNIAYLVHIGCTEQTLLTEIAKCELVCSNCHRVRTWTRLREKGGTYETDPVPELSLYSSVAAATAF